MNRKPSEETKEIEKNTKSNSMQNGNVSNSNISSNQCPNNVNMFVPPPPTGYMIPPYFQWYFN